MATFVIVVLLIILLAAEIKKQGKSQKRYVR
jgi:hypothetical protein